MIKLWYRQTCRGSSINDSSSPATGSSMTSASAIEATDKVQIFGGINNPTDTRAVPRQAGASGRSARKVLLPWSFRLLLKRIQFDSVNSGGAALVAPPFVVSGAAQFSAIGQDSRISIHDILQAVRSDRLPAATSARNRPAEARPDVRTPGPVQSRSRHQWQHQWIGTTQRGDDRPQIQFRGRADPHENP